MMHACMCMVHIVHKKCTSSSRLCTTRSTIEKNKGRKLYSTASSANIVYPIGSGSCFGPSASACTKAKHQRHLWILKRLFLHDNDTQTKCTPMKTCAHTQMCTHHHEERHRPFAQQTRTTDDPKWLSHICRQRSDSMSMDLRAHAAPKHGPASLNSHALSKALFGRWRRRRGSLRLLIACLQDSNATCRQGLYPPIWILPIWPRYVVLWWLHDVMKKTKQLRKCTMILLAEQSNTAAAKAVFVSVTAQRAKYKSNPDKVWWNATVDTVKASAGRHPVYTCNVHMHTRQISRYTKWSYCDAKCYIYTCMCLCSVHVCVILHVRDYYLQMSSMCAQARVLLHNSTDQQPRPFSSRQYQWPRKNITTQLAEGVRGVESRKSLPGMWKRYDNGFLQRHGSWRKGKPRHRSTSTRIRQDSWKTWNCVNLMLIIRQSWPWGASRLNRQYCNVKCK